ncbi:molybdopterin molybdenumtransferase [Peptococcaceae bacterium CEB3]|nr:molybdopterin molybdenumtransferase [Peptococcaceae bacterium CEB3]
MRTYLELEEARELILSRVNRAASEEVALAAAYGRVLARDLYAPFAHPPFDRSPLDGYAYRAEALSKGPLDLKIVSEIPAGTWPERTIAAGEAAKIFTGAPLPPGANCVVRMEDTVPEGEDVVVKRPVLPGANIVPEGDELKRGDFLLGQGTRLSPAAVGLLAAFGLGRVPVRRKPRVGVFSSGSELTEAGEALVPGKIYNSNSFTLRGLLLAAGCEVVQKPLVPDRQAETLQALRDLEDVDMVVTTGGASVGDYDLLPRSLEAYGCEILFWKVRLKPGTPACVGEKDGRLYFSLSGNPAAAMVTFELLVRPALRQCAGLADPLGRKFAVRMAGGFAKGGRQRRFLRAKAVMREGVMWADPEGAQGSGILKSMVGRQLLVDIPGGHGPVEAGEILEAYWMGEWED